MATGWEIETALWTVLMRAFYLGSLKEKDLGSVLAVGCMICVNEDREKAEHNM